jgi:hypothetical protein
MFKVTATDLYIYSGGQFMTTCVCVCVCVCVLFTTEEGLKMTHVSRVFYFKSVSVIR